MIIQMVSIGEHALFIVDYKNSELTFRTSRVPEHRQTEKVTIIPIWFTCRLYGVVAYK